jgi:hypothetical protein
MVRRNLVVLLGLLLAACGGGSAPPAPGAAAPPAQAPADIHILMLGNSHTAFNALPAMVGSMVRAARPGQTVAVETASDFLFLEDRIRHQPTLLAFHARQWQFVVLQAQKYSTSGLFDYSTSAAEEFVRMTRAQGGAAVMFPEWPRRGIDETLRIYDIHKGIAERTGACLAPVGQAWDLSEARRPELALHADDGNHSNPAGAFLAALVLSAAITGESPLKQPNFAQYPVGVDQQAHLRQAAADAVAQSPPRRTCG